MAAEAGQLQLNAMEPLIGYKLLESIRHLGAAMASLRGDCIDGITANADVCRAYLDHSVGLVTALNPYLGYARTTQVARLALQSGRSVAELVLEAGWMSAGELARALRPEAMVGLGAELETAV